MHVLVARTRGFCAGVEMAIKTVEEALQYHQPIYVRHKIVHNDYVVRDLEQKGALFFEDFDEEEIPEGSYVVLSAHGTSPAVREEAERRGLQVIDAVCPLVTKVHSEVRHYAARECTILLIGHREHVEIIGTKGEAPQNVIIVESEEEAGRVEISDPDRVAYAVQTTWSADDASQIIDVLKERFPNIAGPRKSDICYATQNRQDAVKDLVEHGARLVFIVGGRDSSNSNRMVEVARSCGVSAHLITDAADLDNFIFDPDIVVGVSSGASTPEILVEAVIDRLSSLGAESIEEVGVLEGTMHFEVPLALRELRWQSDASEREVF